MAAVQMLLLSADQRRTSKSCADRDPYAPVELSMMQEETRRYNPTASSNTCIQVCREYKLNGAVKSSA